MVPLPHHLAQLRSLCRSHPITPKILFVPSVQAGYNMMTALALAGCDWANLRAVTPSNHAEEQVGPTIAAKGWRRLMPGVDLLLIEEALEAHGLFPGSYFSNAGSGSASALAPAFARTVHELRLAGVEAQQLRLGAIKADKASVIASVCEAYQNSIQETKCYDDAHLYACALDKIEKTGELDGDTIFAIADATPLPELAHRYVQEASGGELVRIGHAEFGMAPVPHSAGGRLGEYPLAGDAPPPVVERVGRRSGDYIQGDLFAAADPVADDAPKGKASPSKAGQAGADSSTGGVHPACALLISSAAPTPTPSTRTQLREAHGCESEVRGVLREALGKRLPLDSVEIAYTTPTPYLGLLVDLVQRFDVAAHFAKGVPANLTRPGQALAAFYGWILSDFAPAGLVHALRAGQLRLDDSGAAMQESQLAALLAQARVAGGRDSYRAVFERIGADDSGEAEIIERAGAIIQQLLAMVPFEVATLAQVTQMSIGFLNGFAPARGDLDERARGSLIEHLCQIGESADLQRPLPTLIEWLQSRVEEYDCEVSVAHAGSLYIAPVSRAGYSARQHLFVVGMDEYSFPGGIFQDAILLDAEREGVAAALPLQRHGPAAHRWQLARAIGMCPGTVTLVSNRVSLSDGREPYPSPLFQHLQQQLGEDVLETWRLVPERDGVSLDETEQALAGYRDRGYEQRVSQQFPWLVEGARAVRARAHNGLTRFDGWLGGKRRVELAIDAGTAEGGVMSAAKLETLAKCPRQYFLRYVLGAHPPEEVEAATARWLQPSEMGQLLHDLYRDFMSRLTQRGERVDDGNSEHERELLALLDQNIDRFEERVPVLYKAAYQADVIRLRRSARIFLNAEGDHERQYPTTDPHAFEVEFGPITVELSPRVRFSLRGRIDRIDVVKGGAGKQQYEIWDYKTGSPYRFEGRDLLHGGQSLQWVLYAYALEEDTGVKVRRSGYFFSSDRGWGRRFEAMPPERSLVARLLEPLLDMAEQGAFVSVQRDDDNHCRVCDFRRLCSSERKTKRDLSDLREETSQLRAIAGEWERLRHSDAIGTSRDTVQAYLAAAGVDSIDDVLAAEAESSLLHWMSGLQPELEWR